MRVVLLLVVSIAAVISAFANAQENKDSAKETPQLRTYMLTIVEFRMKTPEGGSASEESIAKDFEKLAAAGNLTLSETVRVSLLESFSSSVLFGKSTAVTSGVTQGVTGKVRNMSQREIGTNVKAIAARANEKVLLQLRYQATRNAGEVKEDTAPDMETVNVDTSLLLEIGKRVVVASTTATESSFLLVTVSQQ